MSHRDHTAPVTKHMSIQTRVCLCGSVYLYVGHTCVYLRQDEFLDVAQIVYAVEDHLLEGTDEITVE